MGCRICYEDDHIRQLQFNLSMQLRETYVLIAVIDLPRRTTIGRLVKGAPGLEFGVWRLSEAPENTTKTGGSKDLTDVCRIPTLRSAPKTRYLAARFSALCSEL